MEAYTGFASVYDDFMDNVPYEEWAAYLIDLLREHGIMDGLVAELGCGTGRMTRLLAKAGYDMIGIDLSEEMLEIAREYEFEEISAQEMTEDEVQNIGSSQGIMYLNQDMREFELYGTVRAIVSICDSMNYLTTEAELKQVFRLVNNYLDPDGIFIFDMNTLHKYRDVIGEATIAENREDCSFIWENFFDCETNINQYDVTIFKKVDWEPEEEEDAGEAANPLFERLTETHFQKAYELETVFRLLREAGMEVLAAFEVGTHQPVTEQTERMYIVAGEGHQEGKLYV